MSDCWYSHGALHFCDYSLSCQYNELQMLTWFWKLICNIMPGVGEKCIAKVILYREYSKLRFVTSLMSASPK